MKHGGLLSIVVHFCPLLPILPIVAHCCSLLPIVFLLFLIVAHFCPLLSIVARCCQPPPRSGCGEYSDIRIYSNIFRYKYSFVSYSYHFLMRIYIYLDICSYHFLMRIYSDIRSYRSFHSNIFKRKI